MNVLQQKGVQPAEVEVDEEAEAEPNGAEGAGQ